MKTKNLISTLEAMRVLNLSYDGFNRCLLNRKIQPVSKVGNKNYFDAADVEALNSERRKNSRFNKS